MKSRYVIQKIVVDNSILKPAALYAVYCRENPEVRIGHFGSVQSANAFVKLLQRVWDDGYRQGVIDSPGHRKNNRRGDFK